jgi:hypothetical protein
MSDNNSPLDNFIKGFRDGYNEQSARIDKDTSDTSSKLKEGIVSGIVEGLANPSSWLKALISQLIK